MSRNTNITNILAVVLMTPRSESYIRGYKYRATEGSCSGFCCLHIKGDKRLSVIITEIKPITCINKLISELANIKSMRETRQN